MLVFADTFVAETSTGDVIYDAEDIRRVDEYDFPRRLAETISIHKRLEEGGERCKRVVRYLGSTPSCYRIENPHPTKSECMVPRDILASHDDYWRYDALLALHQRWALQYLSACRHAHAKGIVIVSAPAECTWLRPDSRSLWCLWLRLHVARLGSRLAIGAGITATPILLSDPVALAVLTRLMGWMSAGHRGRIFFTGLVGFMNL